MSNLQLLTTVDSAYSTAQTPEGTNIRQIQYQIQGVTRQPLDAATAKQLFYNNMATNKPRSVWAVAAPDDTIVLLSDIVPDTTAAVAPVVTNLATTAATTTISTVASAVAVVPAGPVTSVLTPRYTGSLLLRNFNPSDSDAIIQTLQQLWIQALGNSSTWKMSCKLGKPTHKIVSLSGACCYCNSQIVCATWKTRLGSFPQRRTHS